MVYKFNGLELLGLFPWIILPALILFLTLQIYAVDPVKLVYTADIAFVHELAQYFLLYHLVLVVDVVDEFVDIGEIFYVMESPCENLAFFCYVADVFGDEVESLLIAEVVGYLHYYFLDESGVDAFERIDVFLYLLELVLFVLYLVVEHQCVCLVEGEGEVELVDVLCSQWFFVFDEIDVEFVEAEIGAL